MAMSASSAAFRVRGKRLMPRTGHEQFVRVDLKGAASASISLAATLPIVLAADVRQR
jgi:hypothetical protein